jgi:hypothetical protein
LVDLDGNPRSPRDRFAEFVAAVGLWVWRIARLRAIIEGVEDKDASQEALEQVEKATDSDRAKGEDLLGSDDLKRQLREAKERLRSSEDSEESSER